MFVSDICNLFPNQKLEIWLFLDADIFATEFRENSVKSFGQNLNGMHPHTEVSQCNIVKFRINWFWPSKTIGKTTTMTQNFIRTDWIPDSMK